LFGKSNPQVHSLAIKIHPLGKQTAAAASHFAQKKVKSTLDVRQ